jgi:hypothetical protein
MITSRRTGWEGHAACIETKGNTYAVLVRNPEEII